MYPTGGFPTPVGSFSIPVAPPGVDPTAGPLVYVGINCAWLPYITGALTQLLLQSTWDTNDPDVLSLVRGQATDLMNLFNCAILPTLEELCKSTQGGSGDCMGCCLRFQDGVLQMLDCGVWVDVPGQGDGPMQPSQPGAGTGTPPPNGGTNQYCGALAGNQKWYLPFLVNSGDVLLVSGLNGAANDSRELFWHCGDGWLFVEDACWENIQYNESGDPLMGTRHMEIVANIGGTYYDILLVDNQGATHPFTVPSGITNAQVILQYNTDYTAPIYGDVAFCVDVTNNASGGAFVEPQDFQRSPGNWHTCGNGTYTVGVGFTDTLVDSGPNSYRGVNLCLDDITPFHLTRITFDCDATLGSSPQNVACVVQPSGTVIILTANVAGIHEYDSGPIDEAGVTSIEFDDSVGQGAAGGDPGGSLNIAGVTVYGDGANPFS